LTCRANQGHIGIIADIIEPAPETAAGFSFRKTITGHKTITGRFQFIETVSSNFLKFVESRPSERSQGRTGEAGRVQREPLLRSSVRRRPPKQLRLDILLNTRPTRRPLRMMAFGTLI
jgi:hypothetical protein